MGFIKIQPCTVCKMILALIKFPGLQDPSYKIPFQSKTKRKFNLKAGSCRGKKSRENILLKVLMAKQPEGI